MYFCTTKLSTRRLFYFPSFTYSFTSCFTSDFASGLLSDLVSVLLLYFSNLISPFVSSSSSVMIRMVWEAGAGSTLYRSPIPCLSS